MTRVLDGILDDLRVGLERRAARRRRRLDPDGAFADPLAGGSRPVPGLGP